MEETSWGSEQCFYSGTVAKAATATLIGGGQVGANGGTSRLYGGKTLTVNGNIVRTFESHHTLNITRMS